MPSASKLLFEIIYAMLATIKHGSYVFIRLGGCGNNIIIIIIVALLLWDGGGVWWSESSSRCG